MNSPLLYQEIALQKQRRFQEQAAPKPEQSVERQHVRPIRSTLGQMLIAAGLRLAPALKASSQFQAPRATVS
jgi:hypothetical protein